MDIGDCFYGVGLGLSMFLVTGAELVSLLILACGFFAGRRARVCFAIVAVLFVAAAHCAIASEGAGWWRKVFVGFDPVQDVLWPADGYDHTNDPPIGWLAFNALSHLVLLTFTVHWWRASQNHLRSLKQKLVSAEL